MQYDCITVSQCCCICHSRDRLQVRGQVNYGSAVPDTHVACEVARSHAPSAFCCFSLCSEVDSQRTFLRYTNSHMKHSGARKSHLLTCLFRPGCYFEDITADYRRMEGTRPPRFDPKKIYFQGYILQEMEISVIRTCKRD